MNLKKEGNRFTVNYYRKYCTFFTVRHSQVSIFMILSIVLILMLVTFLILYFNTRSLEHDTVIPTELSSAKLYTDYCLDVATYSILSKLGEQGGYLELPSEVTINPVRRLSLYDGAEYIPYWYAYNSYWIPSEEQVEAQVSPALGKAFVTCLYSEEFAALGFTMDSYRDQITSQFTINDNDVTVEIVYPIEIRSLDGKRSTRLSKFTSNYDVDLRHVLKLAEAIAYYSGEYNFFENATLMLMTMSPDIPFSDMRMDCKPAQWKISDIKFSLQNALSSAFTEVRVVGTDTYPYQASDSVYESYREYASGLRDAYSKVSLVDTIAEYDGYETAINREVKKVKEPSVPLPDDAIYYFSFRMPLSSKNDPASKPYENLSVDIMYDYSYGMDIAATPSTDGILSTQVQRGMQKYLSPLCMNIYHFSYDVTYPVLIYVHDAYAFKGEGYSLRFAFPVYIRRNEASRKKTGLTYQPAVSKNDDFCKNGDGSRKPIRVYDQSDPLQSIPFVNVSMLCVNRECPLGVTSSIGKFLANITTACGNPYLVARKEGYLDGYYLVENTDDLDFEIPLTKLKNYSVSVVAYHLLNDESNVDQGVAASTNSMVMLSLRGLAGEQIYEESFVFNIVNGKALEQITLPIIDGEYEATITYLKNGEDYSGGYFGMWKPSANSLRLGNSITLSVLETLSSTLEDDAAKALGTVQLSSMPRLAIRIEGQSSATIPSATTGD